MTTDGTLALAALQWATHAMETRAVVTRAAMVTRAMRSPTRSFARATGRPTAAAVSSYLLPGHHCVLFAFGQR